MSAINAFLEDDSNMEGLITEVTSEIVDHNSIEISEDSQEVGIVSKRVNKEKSLGVRYVRALIM